MGPGPKKEEERAFARESARHAGAGLQFAGAILMFMLAGRWLDARLGTEPWLLLIGVFFGAGTGFYSLYRQMVIVPRERERGRRGD